MSRSIRTLATLLCACLLWACEEPAPAPPPETKPVQAPALRYFGHPADGKLHVYFLDVDQGDATLIVSPDGHTVLVDAGPPFAGTHLANRLPELLTNKLDLVILTHPHLDHYGGLPAAVGAVGASRLLEPQLPNTPSDYDALLASLAAKGVEVFSPEAPPGNEPLRLPLGGGAELSVLWPRVPTEKLLTGEGASESNSIVLRLTYRDTTVLLMGDAREQTERRLMQLGAPLSSTLLKVATHGTATATSAAFLEAVQPRAAILSTGTGNPESAPSRDVLGRLEAMKVRLFRTDRDGEVHAVSDGQRFAVSTQRRPESATQGEAFFEGMKEEPPSPPPAHINLNSAGPEPKSKLARAERPESPAQGKGPFVASKRSDKRLFHKPDCFAAKRIKSQNKVVFKTRADAEAHQFHAHACAH
ncbi:ComEC/Rec2 family competence protein [Melittangium boletus]|uniref:MBL fold hydrolase n=1 Tax=Melittangium boletus DSM 14713 TaxID=1294270 RepID=A0A250I9Q1_9BACT|nr:MBL fold metallo-hydrolase [Melittangium boletus]ATB27928.1 MBL fold hydrolase [Melittangium boletus DSM 14713]